MNKKDDVMVTKSVSKKDNPLISVVMSAYNIEKYIRAAIESILNQTFEKFEFIIMNNGSTDKTLDIIKSFKKKDSRIKVVNNDTTLIAALSLNKGISIASSNIIARMDGDDIALPNRLELQYKLINSSPNIAVVGSNIIIMDKDENEMSIRGYPDTDEKLKRCLFKYSPFAHPVVMFRKNMFEEVGGYDPKYLSTEDLDLWFKLGSKYKFASIKKPLLKYRISETSSSHSMLKDLEILVFKVRFNAIVKLGYRPNISDIIYNLMQFITLWFTSDKYRIKMYNLLRNNDLI